MQAYMAKITWLKDKLFVIEEKSQAIRCVVSLGFDLFMREECDLRIFLSKKRDEFFCHCARQSTAMTFLKLHRIGEPSKRVTNRPDWKLYKHFAIGGRVLVTENTLSLLPDFSANPRIITFGAADTTCLEFGLV
jgi:hypothetical protein